MTQKKYLLRAFSTLMGLRIGSVLLQMLLFMLVVRMLEKEAVGFYALINTSWLFGRMLGPMGMDHATMRYTPKFRAEGKDHLIRRNDLLNHARIVIITSLISLLAVIGKYQGLLFHNFSETLISIAALGFPAYAFIGLFAGQLRSHNLNLASQIPDNILLPLIVILGLILGRFYMAVHLEHIVLAQCAAAWLVVLIYAVLWRKHTPKDSMAIPKKERRAFRSASMAIFITVALASMNMLLPVFLIAPVLGAAMVAMLETALRLARPLSLTTWAMGMVISPILSQNFSEKRTEELQQIFTLGCWLSFVPALLGFVVLCLAGRPLIEFIAGGDYLQAYLPMIIIAGTYLIDASTGPIARAYIMTDHEKIPVIFSCLQLVWIVPATYFFANDYGIIGALSAIFIGQCIRDIGMVLLLKPVVGLHAGVWSLHGWHYMRTGLASGIYQKNIKDLLSKRGKL